MTTLAQALTDLREWKIGSETVRQWPEAWQRAAVAEGLIVIADGRVKLLEPAMLAEVRRIATVPEPVRRADFAELTTRLDRPHGKHDEQGERAAPVWMLGGRKLT